MNSGRRSPESMTDRAVLLPERFRAGCAFGAGPALAGPVSPTGQIEVGILPPGAGYRQVEPFCATILAKPVTFQPG